jgi:hypothetical protein
MIFLMQPTSHSIGEKWQLKSTSEIGIQFNII